MSAAARTYLRFWVPALAALAALALSATAQADYEQVGLFAQEGNGAQLQGSRGIAVNITGAGGVEAGSVYVASLNRVSHYNAKGEIKEVWGKNTIASGPDQSTGFERCRPANGDTCTQESPSFIPGEEVGEFAGLEAIAIDQSTGYVYVVYTPGFGRTHNLIEVFSADGSESIARFGDAGTFNGESFDEGPAKLHPLPPVNRGIAVDESGKLYLTDIGNGGSEYRVMCFAPESPGDYEHYAYCGRAQDIKESLLGASYLSLLALDNAGHIYVGGEGAFQELSLAEPAAPPLCTANASGQAYAMTVNPLTGELFYFNSNNGKIYRLKPCDPAKGEFEAAQAPVKGTPPALEVRALAINPTLSWGPNRPPGALYGADGASHRGETPPYNGLGYILAPAEAHSPEVLAESVSDTRTTSTVLHAEINPNGQATRYVFQYLTEAAYEENEPSERFAGASEAPAGGGEIEGGGVGKVGVSIAGLAPDTAYRFRLVASSECNGEGGEPCLAEGEALSFATYPLFPPGLPDHRAYELVSPAQKHGGEVIPAEPRTGSCRECKPNAFGIEFPMQSSPDGEALAYEGQPFNPFEGAVNYDSYVSRRTASGWQSTALIPALPPGGSSQVAFDSWLEQGLLSIGFSALELQPTSEPGVRTPLFTETPPNRTTGPDAFRVAYGGHSANFSRIFFAANDSLTEGTAFAPEPPDPGASKNDLYEWHEGQLTLVDVLPGNATVATGAKFASTSPDTNAVSADGSKVFFEDEAGNLYVREDGEATRQIADPGRFLSASPDGSGVLLTDGCLYSLESESCTDLTEGKGGFKGLVGQSKDLSHAYFVDTEALGGGEANEAGEVAEAGKNNLYSWSGGEARFVAILLTSDGSDTVEAPNDWAASPAARQAEASPDGRFLAFSSSASLTGYDNVGPCESVPTKDGGTEVISIPCSEAFLYDSATGKLVCASCNPTGEAPLGETTLRRIGQPSPAEELPQPRYLTDEGRLYFDSQDSLNARDTNEGVEDVYEFSPQGAGALGTCEREGGCVRLISAGTEPVDSNLIAVDETGKNVFFDTRDKLALKDKDELLDVYDAREGGGIAAETEISRAECQGENCQAPVTPPNDPTPASSSFEGAGNVKEPSAAKKHKKHAKKKHKRHSKKHKKAKGKGRAAKRNHGGAK